MSNALTKWLNLMQLLNISPCVGQVVFDGLVARYTESHRFYHTLRHVLDMLDIVDGFRLNEPDSIAIHLATWFHDCVYQPRRNDNEERSAQLAGTLLDQLGVGIPLQEQVRRMILATKFHNPTNDTATAILLDADLAILGSLTDVYQDYTGKIRKEYGWVPELIYKRGRVSVLKSFVERSKIYQTTTLNDRFERQARRNIANELAQLSGGA